MAGVNLEEMIRIEFITSPNREIHAKSLKNKIEYLIFDHCCSLVKQVQAGIPQERIREWLIKS